MTPDDNDLNRKRRQRNLVLGGILIALVVMFYLLTIVRLGTPA